MTKVCDAFGWEELSSLTEEDMGYLLGFYASGDVPTFDALASTRERAEANEVGVFDGSFGFSVGA